MCLVALAWGVDPEYPLILAGNRDEYHARASAPAAWWADCPQVFGGRDLVAGGSWLACSRNGRIAVVINDPRRRPDDGHDRSRGDLVQDFVAGTQSAPEFLESLARREHRYAGFQLLIGTVTGGFMGFRSPAGSLRGAQIVQEGVSAWSNSPPDAPWPKVRFLERELRELLRQRSLGTADLLAPLARRAPLDGQPAEAAIRATPFVVGSDYGTRATTVLRMDARGSLSFLERRFAPDGSVSGESAVDFSVSA